MQEFIHFRVNHMKTSKYITNVIEVDDKIKIIEFCEVFTEKKEIKKNTRKTSLDKFVG